LVDSDRKESNGDRSVPAHPLIGKVNLSLLIQFRKIRLHFPMNGGKILKGIGIFLCWMILSGISSAANAGSAGRSVLPGKPLVLAVEFNTHAAAAYVAKSRGFYRAEGLQIKTFDSYASGMALAAALARKDVDAAYVCLVPAISAYANGGVRLKVVSGTHLYGYAIVVDPNKIKTPQDLQKPGIRIGCVREGNPADLVFQKAVSDYRLDKAGIWKKIRRMDPPEQILALQMGRLDAAVMPEHYPSVAVAQGFRVLFSARDIWPEMQGSVLVVSERLIESSPEIVGSLVKVNRQATRWIKTHPKEAAVIVADALQVAGNSSKLSRVSLPSQASLAGRLTISPEVALASLTRGLEITEDVDPIQVQRTIDYMSALGMIRSRFDSKMILKLDWPES
jgi:NitT/TauT family transport system substrate-binding protein